MIYETNKYIEYFEIDEGYYPEINESSIKDPKNKWQYTFPHKDIVALMKMLEAALSRSGNDKKKSIWLEGSYGTGKSRILWMLQSLLTCPESDFDAYFDEYDNLRGETDLRERLRTIRRGKIVTASRYATGGIISTQKLIFAVFESLTAALRRSGCKFDGAKTLRGKIASWLESDSANLELFRAKIRKPEYRAYSTLFNHSAEEIVERLKNPNSKVEQLVEDILRLGEREGIRAFDINMSDLTAWISEVIAENKLGAIILFWDEFSKFFGNNRNNLDEFQKLAELSNNAPFYLVIATHQAKDLVGAGDKGFATLYDRLNHMEITMPDNIAFELIGHALKVKSVAKDVWKSICAALAERTAAPREAVMNFAERRKITIRDEKVLTDILPIHPIAAILLKNLSAYLASNQRSIFNFIKNNDPNIKTFQDFIATKSPDDGDLLTIDYLWDFLYDSSTKYHGSNSELKYSIRTILDSYALNENNLSSDEKIVLKTVLLIQALERIDLAEKMDRAAFHPTEENLELAFTGTDMEGGRAVTIANDLVRKGILFRKPDRIPDKSGKMISIETFAVMALSGDFAELEKLKNSIAENVRTVDLVESANLLDAIPLTPAQRARYDLRAVTADNFTATINRITNEPETYRIKAVVCFARTEDEQNKIHDLIGDAIRNERYRRLVFIDASANLISHEDFNQWVENSANEKYSRGKDNAQADQYKNNAADCLKSWKRTFETGSFVFYPATKNDGDDRRKISCQNAEQITDALKDNVRRIYPYAFDDAKITDTLFQPSQLKNLAKSGIEQTEYSMLKRNSIKVVLGDAWQMSGNYWEVYPDVSISRLKVEVDALIKTELDRNVRISFDEIFAYLSERGFMPVNIYAFLTGFLLKEYAGDPYRFSAGIDGIQGGTMSVAKLAECINESIKQTISPVKNYRPKYLEKMSQNQQQFMLFASEIFGVTEDVSVEQCAQKFRLKLITLGYPLWCYVDAAEDAHKNFLQNLAGIANTQGSDNISALAERAGQFLSENPEAFHDLKNFLTAERGREIFTDFVKNFDDGIIFDLAQKIGLDDPCEEFRRRITAGDGIWLRDKDTAIDDLQKLIVDYKIVAASQKFGIGGKSLKACVQNWADYCRFNLKIPADTIGDYHPPIKNFFARLKEICTREEIPQEKREFFLCQIVDNAKEIRTAISELPKILRDKYSYQLDGLSDAEINDVYSSLPYSSFTDSEGHYRKNLQDLAKKIQSSQLKSELLTLWREVAGNKLPREWSREHRTPILALVPQAEQDTAKNVFATVMSPSPNEKDVRFAIEYLKSRPPYFAALKDSRQIEKAFRDAVIGESKVLFDSNDEVRDELEQKFHGDVYDWYPSVRAKEILKKFVENKYYTSDAHDKLTELVMRMPDEDAKTLLIELLDKNYEVGLKLLREFGDGKFEH